MATIKIQRTSEYINSLRNYRIFIDGQKIGTIANGKTKEFEITAGRHSIVGKIDWCSSPELTVDLNDNDTKTFLIGGFKNGNWIMPITIGVIVLCFVLTYALRVSLCIASYNSHIFINSLLLNHLDVKTICH